MAKRGTKPNILKKSIPKPKPKPKPDQTRAQTLAKNLTPKPVIIDSESDTSPFKGFPPQAAAQTSTCDTFDKLLNESERRPFPAHNQRTYSNRTKRKSPERKLIKFEDSKNQELIQQWLNDPKNKFDRLTQTQNFAPDAPILSQTYNLRSVSQNVDDLFKSKKVVRKSTHRMRTRSLNITKEKPPQKQVFRHSSAGDTPSMENYVIEEVNSNENMKMIIDMLEDRYLNEIEQHFEQPATSAWTRAKEMKKTLKKRQPKRLNITQSQKTQVSIRESILSQEHQVCDAPATATRYEQETDEPINVENVENCIPDPIINIHNMGERLLVGIDSINSEQLNELLPYLTQIVNRIDAFTGIREKSSVEKSSTETQTCVEKSEKLVQTNATILKSIDTQTAYNKSEKLVQTNAIILNSIDTQTVDNFTCIAETQTSVENCAKQVQTVHCLTKNMSTQTDLMEINDKNLIITKASTSNGNAGIESNDKRVENKEFWEMEVNDIDTDDILAINIYDEPNIVNKVNNNVVSNEIDSGNLLAIDTDKFKSANVKDDPKFAQKNDHNVVNYEIDSDDLLSIDIAAVETEPNVIKTGNAKPKTIYQLDSDDIFEGIDIESAFKEKQSGSDIVISMPSNKANQSVKNELKRKISEEYEISPKRPCNKFLKNLSIDFETCPYTNTEKIDRLPTQKEQPAIIKETKRTTQELIDECDLIIYNATNSRPKKVANRIQEAVKIDLPVIGNINPNTDSDYFETNVGPSTSKVDQNCVIDNRKSIPVSNQNCLIDVPKSIPVSNTAKSEPKIKILENLIIEPAKQDESDEDVIDSTPDDLIEEEIIDKEAVESPKLDILTVKSKITSTPNPNQFDSEKIALSPIANDLNPVKPRRFTPVKGKIVTPKSRTKKTTLTPKSSQKNSILNFLNSSNRSSQPLTPQKPVVSCTRLNRAETVGIMHLVEKKLIEYSAVFTTKVTHMVVKIDDKNCVKDHTIKYVSAIASGIWVLNLQWIEDCNRAEKLLPEESYEVLDLTGLPGPRESRLKRTLLLKEYKIYAAPPFLTYLKEDLERIIKSLGGTVVQNPDDLLDRSNKIRLIIAEAQMTQDFNTFNSWLEVLRIVTVDLEWLSRSVGAFQIQKLQPHVLCSNDMLENLDYPPELLTPY